MKLYHGSNTGNIKILEPRQADHERPYIYMTTIEAVAAIYLCNGVERPYYWFPYGFERNSDVPIYHELYPNALREVSEGVAGFIYEMEAAVGVVVCRPCCIFEGKRNDKASRVLVCGVYKKEITAGMGTVSKDC